MAPRIAAFNGGLRDLGYVEGRNIFTTYRWGNDKDNVLDTLAAELLAMRLDIVVVHGVAAARAVKRRSTTVPTICFACGDVLSTGLVSSLAAPGGNLTGLTIVAPEVTGKRIELLRQVVPKLTRLGVLWNEANPVATRELKETEAAARTLGIEVHPAAVRDAGELPAAIASLGKSRADALLVLSDAMLYGQRSRIAALSFANQLPATSWTAEFAREGGLMTYGPDVLVLARRAASYVDRVLNGGKPGEIPIEQPLKFELAINLKTARALNLSVPSALLLRADEVIE